MDGFPVEDAKRYATEFCEFLDARHPEVFTTIRDSGDLSDETEHTLQGALESFNETFRASQRGPGSASGLGETTPPDEVKPDVGWDRMSSVDEDATDGDG
jgi:hypothetical protein